MPLVRRGRAPLDYKDGPQKKWFVGPIPLLAEEGWREAPGWSVRPKRFAGLTTPSAPSAHPPLLCEEGNTLYQLMGFTKCLLTTGSAGFEPSSGSSMKIVYLLPISKL